MFDCPALFTRPERSPALIVAEIGINHNGSLEQAKCFVDSAVDSGADAVKFQVFRTERFYSRKVSPEAFDIFKGYELTFDEFAELKTYVENRGKIFTATPLDDLSLRFLTDLKTEILKIASSDITTEPFLARAAESGIPTVVSTGFVGMPEIERAVRFFEPGKLALLYCVSRYPAEPADFDLNFIPVLARKFGVPAGFSDHSEGIDLSLAAVTLGAKIVERHFTTDKTLPGADHAMSLEPGEFAAMVRGIRRIESALGKGEKKITGFEDGIRSKSMRDVYAARDIRKGETINENDILLIRPGSGIAMERYRAIIGSTADKDIGVDERI